MKIRSPIVVQKGENTNANVNEIKKGIFISNDARESLNLTLSEEQFEILKTELNEKSDEKFKCFINNRWYALSEGLFIQKKLVADSLEKSLQTAEQVYNEFKQKVIICHKCGKKFTHGDKSYVSCPYCEEITDLKKYKKKIKMPETKRIAFKLYISHLRR